MTHNAQNPAGTGSPLLASVRLATAYGGIQICLWLEQARWVGIAIVAITLVTSFLPWRGGRVGGLPSGLGWGSIREATLRSLPLLIGALALLGYGWLGGHWPGTRFILVRISVYFGWALVQQFFLQTFTQNTLRLLHDGPRLTPLMAALLFGMTHLPNLLLIVVSVPVMTYLCFVFRRSPCIYPLALVHAILGVFVDDVADIPMRIGPGYLAR